jgi:hypothetical protein
MALARQSLVDDEFLHRRYSPPLKTSTLKTVGEVDPMELTFAVWQYKGIFVILFLEILKREQIMAEGKFIVILA